MLLIDEQGKWFLEMGTTPGKDAAKTVGMTTKDEECHVILVTKAVAGVKRTDSNFESSTVGKMLPNSITCYRKMRIRKTRGHDIRELVLATIHL